MATTSEKIPNTLEALPKGIQHAMLGVDVETILKMVEIAEAGDPVASALVQFWHKPERIANLRDNMISRAKAGAFRDPPIPVQEIENYFFIGPDKEWKSVEDLMDYGMRANIRNQSFWTTGFHFGTPIEYQILYKRLRHPLIENSRLTDDAWMPGFIKAVPLQANFVWLNTRWGNEELHPNSDLWLRILRNPKYLTWAMGTMSKTDLRSLIVLVEDVQEAMDILRPYKDTHEEKVQHALRKIKRKVPKHLRLGWIDLVKDTEAFCYWKASNPDTPFPSWPPCAKYINHWISRPSSIPGPQLECLEIALRWQEHLS